MIVSEDLSEQLIILEHNLGSLLISKHHEETAILLYLMSNNRYNRDFCLRGFLLKMIDTHMTQSPSTLKKVSQIMNKGFEVDGIESDISNLQATLLRSKFKDIKAA